MPIGVAVASENMVNVYDEAGRLMFAKPGELHGYTSTTVSIREGERLVTYDEDGLLQFATLFGTAQSTPMPIAAGAAPRIASGNPAEAPQQVPIREALEKTSEEADTPPPHTITPDIVGDSFGRTENAPAGTGWRGALGQGGGRLKVIWAQPHKRRLLLGSLAALAATLLVIILIVAWNRQPAGIDTAALPGTPVAPASAPESSSASAAAPADTASNNNPIAAVTPGPAPASSGPADTANGAPAKANPGADTASPPNVDEICATATHTMGSRVCIAVIAHDPALKTPPWPLLKAIVQSLESIPPDTSIPWQDDATGMHGTVTPARASADRSRRRCRWFTFSWEGPGIQTFSDRDWACRSRDRHWR